MTIKIDEREYNAAINKARMDGYKLGYETGRQDAIFARFTPNEIRKIVLGLEPIKED